MESFFEKYFFLFFPLFWIFICYVISLASGWHKLAENYCTQKNPPGILWRFESAKMRMGASYTGCLTFSTTKTGLWLSVFFIFRPGHPPLYIPWSKVVVSSEKRFFRRVVRIEIDGVSIIMKESLAYSIRGVAGSGWPKH